MIRFIQKQYAQEDERILNEVLRDMINEEKYISKKNSRKSKRDQEISRRKYLENKTAEQKEQLRHQNRQQFGLEDKNFSVNPEEQKKTDSRLVKGVGTVSGAFLAGEGAYTLGKMMTDYGKASKKPIIAAAGVGAGLGYLGARSLLKSGQKKEPGKGL